MIYYSYSFTVRPLDSTHRLTVLYIKIFYIMIVLLFNFSPESSIGVDFLPGQSQMVGETQTHHLTKTGGGCKGRKI